MRRGVLRVAAAGCAALLMAVGPARLAAAHDVPDEVTVQGFIAPAASSATVLLRVPMLILGGADVPRRGPGYLDLRHARPGLRDAAADVAKALRLTAGGRPLAARVTHARVSLPSDRSFDGYDRAAAHLRADPLPPDTDLYYNQGYLDIGLRYQLPQPDARLHVQPDWPPDLQQRLHLRLRYLPRRGQAQDFDLAGALGPVPLEPSRPQVGMAFARAGAARAVTRVDSWALLVMLLLPTIAARRRIRGTAACCAAGCAATLAAVAVTRPAHLLWEPLAQTLVAAGVVVLAAGALLFPRRGRGRLVGLACGVAVGAVLAQQAWGLEQFAGGHWMLAVVAFDVGAVAALSLPLAAALATGRLLTTVLPQPWRGVAVVALVLGHTAWHWTVERAGVVRTAAAADAAAVDWRVVAGGLRQAAVLALVAALGWLAWEVLARGRRRPSGRGEEEARERPA